MWRFEASPRRATSKGQTFITHAAPHSKSAPTYIPHLPPAFVAHRHHLPPGRRRLQPVPGHGDRLSLPAPGRVGDRRAHAHRPDRRRAVDGPRHSGLAGRGDLPQRSRSPAARTLSTRRSPAVRRGPDHRGGAGSCIQPGRPLLGAVTPLLQDWQGARWAARQGRAPPDSAGRSPHAAGPG